MATLEYSIWTKLYYRKNGGKCPWAETTDTVYVISGKMSDTSEDTMVFIHVGTNDIGDRRSGAQFKEFQNHLRQRRVKGKLRYPEFHLELVWGISSFHRSWIWKCFKNTNNVNNIKFSNFWEILWKSNRFANDGVHLSRKEVISFCD